ncbi:MAG: DUF4129 domain-containing protein, partial [Chloroflexota bacterium]|nr:DUF4129 domain-containing protein [Chloroflexota bacterium]
PPVPASGALNRLWNDIDGPLVGAKLVYDRIGVTTGAGTGVGRGIGLAARGSHAADGTVSGDAPVSSLETPADLPFPQPVGPIAQSEHQRHFPWAIFWAVPAVVAGLWFALTSRGSRISAALAYARLTLLGHILGLRPRSWQTPHEFGRELQRRRGFQSGDTDAITALYSAARYGERPLGPGEHNRAWRAWQRVRGRLVKFWERG